MLPNQNYVALFHGQQNIGWWPSHTVRGRTRFQPWRTCTFDEPYRRRLAQNYNVGEKVWALYGASSGHSAKCCHYYAAQVPTRAECQR